MNDFLTDDRGPNLPANVTEQLQRLRSALGPEWMLKLGVASETVRTWKKRKAIPISQLANAAQMSGRSIEWFTANQYLTQKEPPSFFANQEKQVIHIDDDILAAMGWPSKIDPGQAGELAMQRLQSSTEIIKRVSASLNYEPSLEWTVLIQELIFSHSLTEAGVRRIMETLKSERKAA